jgi:hypothetical protein
VIGDTLRLLDTGVVHTHLSVITRFDGSAVAIAARSKLSGLEGRSPKGLSALLFLTFRRYSPSL